MMWGGHGGEAETLQQYRSEYKLDTVREVRLLYVLKSVSPPTEGSHDRCSTSPFNKANVPIFNSFLIYPLGYPASKRKAENFLNGTKMIGRGKMLFSI